MESEQIKKAHEEAIKSANFNLFKALFKHYVSENLSACTPFIMGISNCENENQLKRYLRDNRDDIYENLGGNSYLDDEIDKLERKISDLEYDIEELECELENSQYIFGTSLADEYKKEFIMELAKQYSPWEIEDLLKNGKEYLKK